MPEQPNKPPRFWEELKRRKVIRVITVYAAAAFVIIELANNITEPLSLPEWFPTLVIVLLAIGFIISIVMSWIFDITPEGIQKTKSISNETPDLRQEKQSKIRGWKIATYASVVIIIGLVIFNVLNRKKPIDLSGLDKTIAVLPFEIYGHSDSSASLHDVLPIAIIGELHNVEGFVVRARGSSLKYEKTNLSSHEIGNELKVNYLITGAVQEQDDNILVYVMLEQVPTDQVIWENSFEMVTDDIMKTQREIARKIATSLKNNFIPQVKTPTDSSKAWLSYLTGLSYYWKTERQSDFELAIRYFERAVQIDPEFCLAYAKLTSCHCMMYHFHYDRTESRLLQARKTLERAKEVDAGDPDVIFAEGVYSYVIQDFEKTLEKYKAAEGLVSDIEDYYLMFGSLYRRKGNLEKAIEYYLKSYEADPQHGILPLELGETYLMLRNYELSEKYFDLYISLGSISERAIINKVYLYLLWERGTTKSRQALMETQSLLGEKSDMELTYNHVRIELIDGKYDEALKVLQAERSDILDHQFFYNPKSFYFADIYRTAGKLELAKAYYDSARVHLEAKIEDTPEDHRYHGSLGIIYAGLGRKKEAIEEGLAAVSLMPVTKEFYKGIFRLEDLARIYTMVGEYDLALEQLDQLLSMPSLMSVNLLKKDPAWKPLWDLPEFEALMVSYSGDR